jgi:ParB family transcriptional regulator, chromosome partitioning protein
MAQKNKKLVEAAAEWVAPSDLKPWAKNPRDNEVAVAKVAASIKRFGFGAPIVARKNGEIIAGHTRWKAAQVLGLDRVPVRYMDLDERQAHLLALADNKLGELADWNERGLLDILGEYSLEESDMSGWWSKDLEDIGGKLTANSEPEEGKDESEQARVGYAVIIECDDEQEQLRVISLCNEQGLKCRALT